MSIFGKKSPLSSPRLQTQIPQTAMAASIQGIVLGAKFHKEPAILLVHLVGRIKLKLPEGQIVQCEFDKPCFNKWEYIDLDHGDTVILTGAWRNGTFIANSIRNVTQNRSW